MSNTQLIIGEIALTLKQLSVLFENLGKGFYAPAPMVPITIEKAGEKIKEKKKAASKTKKVEAPKIPADEFHDASDQWEDEAEEWADEVVEEKVPEITREVVKNLCIEVAKKKGVNVVKDIVALMGVKKSVLVPEKELGRFHALLKEAL
jgi:hypothetical protein